MITPEDCKELIDMTFQSMPPDLKAAVEAERLKIKEEETCKNCQQDFEQCKCTQDIFARYLDASYTVYCQSFKNRGFFVKEEEDDPKNDDNNQA